MERRGLTPLYRRLSQTGSREEQTTHRADSERRLHSDRRRAISHASSGVRGSDRIGHNYREQERSDYVEQSGGSSSINGREPIRRSRVDITNESRCGAKRPHDSAPAHDSRAIGETSAKKARLVDDRRHSERREAVNSTARSISSDQRREFRTSAGHQPTAMLALANRQPPAAVTGSRVQPFLPPRVTLTKEALRRKLSVEPRDLLLELATDTRHVKPCLSNGLLHDSRPELIDPLLRVVHRALQCTAYPQLAENFCRFLSDCELFSTVVHKALVGQKFCSLSSATAGSKASGGVEGAAVWSTMAVYLQIAERILAVHANAWQAVRLVLQELRDQMTERSAGGWQQQPDDEKMLQRVIEAVARARVGSCRRSNNSQTANNDFRSMSIFPTAEELTSQHPLLRPNLLKGAFDDCEHYLDVQFRLLREDFMLPLRSGIAQYQEKRRLGQPVGRLQDVRIYQRITVKEAVCNKTGVNYRLRFNGYGKERLTKKQFLDGTLLCLSANDFQTFFIATVQNYHEDNDNQPWTKEKNDNKDACLEIQVRFEGECAADIIQFAFGDTEFVVLETTAYFESYRHVLESLQFLNQDNLKFQQYLVQGISEGRVHPAYLEENTPVYNLECVATAKARQSENLLLRSVAVKSEDSWPAAHDLGLDNSQFEAFKLALTSDLAVIQGPPGTGKTYIGLKIAKALLTNFFPALTSARKVVPNIAQTSARRMTPLLVVCYTNHALDQFLEGLFRCGFDVVRVGGRSKNELLIPCNISSFRKRSDRISTARAILEDRSRAVTNIINEQNSLGRRIVNFQFLEEIMHPSHASQIVPRPDDEEHVEQLLSDDELLRCWLDPDGADRLASGKEDQKHTEKLRLLIASEPLTTEDEHQVKCVWDLTLRQRWQLYATWIRRYSGRLRNDLAKAVEEQAEAARVLEELRAFEDVKILQRAKVIGMTTTGAAKYRKLLQEVKPKVIIVEEAAQVLEGHIVTMLGAGCDHLILIGDHQQLRPSVNVYELAKKYHLDVSLFERMVQNGMPFCTLTTQHRMRLEVSAVMRQFYPHLKDDDRVKDRDSIKGMKFNMFYVSHNESENEDEHNATHYNRHEANFLVALCRYLLQQGYKPSQITILTPYNGQVSLLRQLITQRDCGDVIVTSIDNYQGEENDLILLSTVRSNKNGHAGFTSIPNRICVMLSRAKLGLYAIGDFEMLRKHCRMWKRIFDCVEQGGFLGQQLPLMCQQHKHVTDVKKASDFDQIREGGCASPCDARLECGHTCIRTCHEGADDHSATQCMKPCYRDIKSCGHRCTKLCYERCVPCTVTVTRTLCCGHETSAPCGQPLTSIVCDAPCERLLACGHSCHRRCGDACDSRCLQEVSRVYSCGHTNNVFCHQSEDEAPCKQACDAVLACMHPCKGTCGSCHQGRLHKPCTEECKRPLVCGHLCEGRCCIGCPPCKKPCENRCAHNKCKKTCGELCAPCREPCKWECKHYKCTRLCFEPCDRPPCNRPCKKIVRCPKCRRPYLCIGLCGEPCPAVCDRCQPTKPYRDLFFGEEAENSARFVQLEDCGHVVESTGMDRWIKLKSCVTDHGGDQDEDNEIADGMNGRQSAISIQVISCPMCKTPVRRCVRYSTSVNARQVDIEQVKSKILESTRSTNVTRNMPYTATSPPWHGIYQPPLNDDPIGSFRQECLRKIQLLRSEQSFARDLMKVRLFLLSLNDVLRKQEVDDSRTELARIDYGVHIMAALRTHGSSPEAPTEDGNMLRRAAELVQSAGKLDDEKKAFFESCKPIIDKYAPLSQAEKEMVVKAMDFSHKGHWYKCPNGHIYCIGECGGAMEVGVCPDCKCSIGGTSHRLRDDNALASEMDGASRPAYSELNMPDLALLH